MILVIYVIYLLSLYVHMLRVESAFGIVGQCCKVQGENFPRILTLDQNSREFKMIWSKMSQFVQKTYVVLFFSLMSFSKISHARFLMRQQCANALSDNNVLFLHIFSIGFFGVLMRHVFVMVFAQGGVLRIPQLEDWWAHTIYALRPIYAPKAISI